MATGSIVVDEGRDHTPADLGDFPNSRTEAQTGEKRTATSHKEIAICSSTEIGSQVNRFRLCGLVTELSRRIKAMAEKQGESLPMTMIVRAFLRSYRLATQDGHGPLPGSEMDVVNLKNLSHRVLRDEIDRLSRDRMRSSEARLADAVRVGDEARIRAQKEGIEREVKLRAQRANEDGRTLHANGGS